MYRSVNAGNAVIVVIFFAFLFLSVTVTPVHGQGLRLDEEKLASSITFFEKARIKYLPEIGFMEYYPYFMEESIKMLDLLTYNVLTLGKRGDNPEEFNVERSLFSDGQYVYLFDSSKTKLLKYQLDSNKFTLNDIIIIRKPVGRECKNLQSLKVLGRLKDRWVVQFIVYPDLPSSKKDLSQGYSLSVGLSNLDFTEYEELYFIKGKNYPQTAASSDTFLCQVDGLYFAVVLSAVNYDTATHTNYVDIIDIQNKTVKKCSIPIPEKYTELQVLDNDRDLKARKKISRFKMVPWGAKFQGMDEHFYFCYYHYYSDESFDILFTRISLPSAKFDQFEEKKSNITPIMADNHSIFYIKENIEDECTLIVKPRPIIKK